jgi:hypothetical protein
MALSCLLIFSACTTQHYYYLQTPHQVPLFKEEKEVRLSGGGGMSSSTNAKNLQAAGSITDQFAIAANYMDIKNSKETTINGVRTNWWKGRYFEGMFGYYKDFGKFGIFETYAGYGSGAQEHSYASEDVDLYFPFIPVPTSTVMGSSKLNFNKYFVQPSYGISLDVVDIALSLRVSDVFFNTIDNKVNSDYFAYKELEDMNRRSFILFEPAITVRAGWKYVKGQIQYSYTGILAGAYFPYETYHFSMGLNFAFAERFNRKTSEIKTLAE